MTIDKIKSNKILITLCDEDMRDFSLDYDTLSLYDNHSRKILMRILQIACFKTDIEIKDKRMIVEALPTVDGCMLLLTVEDKKRKKYRLQNGKKCSCYDVGNSKNFLDVIQLLYKQNVCCNKNSAYEKDGVYYLIFDYPAIPKDLSVFCTNTVYGAAIIFLPQICGKMHKKSVVQTQLPLLENVCKIILCIPAKQNHSNKKSKRNRLQHDCAFVMFKVPRLP